MKDFEAIGLALKREGVDGFPPSVTIDRIPLNELQTVQVWQIEGELADLVAVKAEEERASVEHVILTAVQSYFRLPEFVGGQSINIKKLEKVFLMSIADADMLSIIFYAIAKARGNTSSVGLFQECLEAYLKPKETTDDSENTQSAQVFEFKT